VGLNLLYWVGKYDFITPADLVYKLRKIDNLLIFY
jgi:hypothetical protein